MAGLLNLVGSIIGNILPGGQSTSSAQSIATPPPAPAPAPVQTTAAPQPPPQQQQPTTQAEAPRTTATPQAQQEQLPEQTTKAPDIPATPQSTPVANAPPVIISIASNKDSPSQSIKSSLPIPNQTSKGLITVTRPASVTTVVSKLVSTDSNGSSYTSTITSVSLIPPSANSSPISKSPSNSSTSSGNASSSKKVQIALGVTFGLILPLLLVAAFFLYKRRQRNRALNESPLTTARNSATSNNSRTALIPVMYKRTPVMQQQASFFPEPPASYNPTPISPPRSKAASTKSSIKHIPIVLPTSTTYGSAPVTPTMPPRYYSQASDPPRDTEKDRTQQQRISHRISQNINASLPPAVSPPKPTTSHSDDSDSWATRWPPFSTDAYAANNPSVGNISARSSITSVRSSILSARSSRGARGSIQTSNHGVNRESLQPPMAQKRPERLTITRKMVPVQIESPTLGRTTFLKDDTP